MFSEREPGDVERVETAAIYLADGRVFTTPRPGRHLDVVQEVIAALGRDEWHAVEEHHQQGFVTSEGYFVGREAAWQLAEEAGQLLDCAPTGPRGTLFSEDIW
jgi:hypothetical protein